MARQRRRACRATLISSSSDRRRGAGGSEERRAPGPPRAGDNLRAALPLLRDRGIPCETSRLRVVPRSGIIDSTGVLEVVSFLEETFGIVVGDSEMLPENLDSVQNLVAFIERKRSASAP